jgi:hypothetical protein
MINVRNGHYELITFHIVPRKLNQNTLGMTTNGTYQPIKNTIHWIRRSKSIPTLAWNWWCYAPNKTKISTIIWKCCSKPKHFHWNPIHKKQLQNLIITFFIFHLKKYSKQISCQQFHLRINIYSSIFSFMMYS